MKEILTGAILVLIFSFIAIAGWQDWYGWVREMGMFRSDREALEHVPDCEPRTSDSKKDSRSVKDEARVLVCVFNEEGEALREGRVIVEFETIEGGALPRTQSLDFASLVSDNIIPLGFTLKDPPRRVTIYAQDIVGRRSEPWIFETTEYWKAAGETPREYGLHHTFFLTQ